MLSCLTVTWFAFLFFFFFLSNKSQNHIPWALTNSIAKPHNKTCKSFHVWQLFVLIMVQIFCRGEWWSCHVHTSVITLSAMCCPDPAGHVKLCSILVTMSVEKLICNKKERSTQLFLWAKDEWFGFFLFGLWLNPSQRHKTQVSVLSLLREKVNQRSMASVQAVHYNPPRGIINSKPLHSCSHLLTAVTCQSSLTSFLFNT